MKGILFGILAAWAGIALILTWIFFLVHSPGWTIGLTVFTALSAGGAYLGYDLQQDMKQDAARAAYFKEHGHFPRDPYRHPYR